AVARVRLALDAPDAVAEPRRRVPDHAVGRLEDVTVGVDDEAWRAHVGEPPAGEHTRLDARAARMFARPPWKTVRGAATSAAVANGRLYLHETIRIVGTGAEPYKRHTGERRRARPDGALVGTWQRARA